MFLPLLVFVGLVAAARSTVNVTINDCPASLSRTQLRVFGSSCYLFVLDHEREFITAERECEAGGGHLVIIRDLATQNFLYNTMRNEFHEDSAVWIGLSDQAYEGTFVWVDGIPAEFTYWASDQPGIMGGIEDCVAMDIRDGGRWNDYRCRDFLFVHNRHTFVCEYPVGNTMSGPTTATPGPTTATPGPTTATPGPTTATAGSTTATPKPITPSTSSGTTACPPFNCSHDCGLSGYKVDENSCLLCECED